MGLWFWRKRVCHHRGRETWQQAGMVSGELRSHITNLKQETEKAKWKWHVTSKTTKPVLSDTIPPAKPHFLCLPT